MWLFGRLEYIALVLSSNLAGNGLSVLSQPIQSLYLLFHMFIRFQYHKILRPDFQSYV